MANTYLTRAISSAGNRTTLTISCWFKRSKLGADQHLFSSRDSGVNSGSIDELKLTSADILRVEGYSGSGYNYRKHTNRVFRDTSAWYHLVVVYDTSNATADDRIKIYINGEIETSFSTSTNPSSSFNTYWFDDTDPFVIGTDVRTLTGASNFDGSISHINVVDGTAYDASAFGSTDANGVWKINTSPSVTYGTNGFFILKNGNSVTDQSGNSNNFTVGGGTLTNTEDSPSNVFATMNPLDNYYASSTFSNGNTTTSMATSGVETFNASTIGVSSGKYYSEVKVITVSSRTHIGVVNKLSDAIGNYIGQNTYSYAYAGYDGNKWNNGDGGSWGNTYTTNDIIGIAMDLDNNKIYFSKNGAWQNSGDPTSGSTGTGSMYNLTASSSTPAGAYFFAGGKRSNDTVKLSWNFGNGYFGTTAVSSAGTNASGIGIFEYDVPTGYTALSTKGLNL
jgi:hypothetical protein